ncbi:lipid biosynthesis B12-binding/radical SAM protein [Desulfosarcina sp.]|uniref:lipid biosynthesis B12-binding/radical SAM protein n=1 Tax=Desulfosarcina sp. TaxID=2027861 RepID=UPI00397062D0
MKILLISANTLKAPYPVYPIGLDHVAASIHGRHQVHIADLNVLDGPGVLADRIRECDPHLIGISLRNIDNTDTSDPVGFIGGYRAVMTTVRQASHAPVVLGGSGFTLFPGRILGELGADFGIVGEGERLNGLIDALEAGQHPKGLPGVITPAEEEIPFPAPWTGERRPRLEHLSAHQRWYLAHGGILNLQTKRGCPFGCIYCTYPLIEGRKLRRVAPRDAARTALALEAKGARYLYITDSSFNADIDHSLEVAGAFIRAGLTIPWGAFFTPLPMPDGYFETLAQAGLKHVEFGTDSLSDKVLRSYGKPFTVDQVLAVHEAALAAGRHVAHYFLLGGPGETRQTLEETLTQIDTLRKAVLFFFCGMRVYPHTALFHQCAEKGYLDAQRDLLAPVFFNGGNMGDDEILQRVNEKAAGRANWVVGSGGRETAATIARMYQKGFSGPLWEHLIR